MARSARRRQSWIPWFALGATLLLTAVATWYTAMIGHAREELRFRNVVEQTNNAIQARMETYLALLRAGAGLFAGSEVVGHGEFRSFVRRLELQSRYPGIQGLGFTQRVPAAHKEAFEEWARAELQLPEFHIWPEAPRPLYHTILYLEPLDRRNQAAIGYDMFTEPVRRAAMEGARDSGNPVASGRITLVQEIDPEKQAGFLVYMPVYRTDMPHETVDERREALLGFVYSPFRADDLLHGIFGGGAVDPRVALAIYAGSRPSPKDLLHMSNRDASRRFSAELHRTTTLEIAGTTWCAVYDALPGFGAGVDRSLPGALAGAGLLLAALLFLLTRAQVEARAQAEPAARDLARSEEALRQSQKMEAIGRLAGGVAHDFNNVLTAINGYSELMLVDLPPEHPHRVYVEEIQRAGQRAAGFVGQLLAFGRKQMTQTRVIDLNASIGDLDRMLRRLIPENIEIKTDLAPEIGHVRADVGRVEQIVVNLAVNARDAMPDGGVLTIATSTDAIEDPAAAGHPEARPGRYVVLSVSDTGVGMAPEVLAHVFEPFFTTKAPGHGTGLGLATVYGIATQSGGFVTVESAPGRGSRFRVHFPQVEGEPERLQPQVVTGPAPAGAETILLVEDEDLVRAFARDALQRAGYTVHVAGDADEAVEAWQRLGGRIDLLLTDVIMPGQSGRELAERLREQAPGLLVLYMSGYTHGVIDESLRQPGTGFIAKPFTAQALAIKVREVLNAAERVPNRRAAR